ncbi:MAG: ABC transporter permease [Tissierellia bacterium]|nr:ABC transporter permease [Tissierellia bacterium]
MENKWDVIQVDKGLKEKLWSKNRTFAGDVWFRFSHKRSAVVGLLVVLLVGLFAFVGPKFTNHTYDAQNLSFVNVPPNLKVTPYNGSLYYITGNLKVLEVSGNGKLLGELKKVREDDPNKEIVFETKEGELKLSYKQKPARIVDGNGERIENLKSMWNKSYILGTDQLGRDLLARLMYGSRISIIVALVATVVNMTIGIIYGGISGFKGGMADVIMMRIVDIISTIPLTLYVILIMVFLNSGFLSIIIALSSVYWVSMARVVRGQIFSLKQQEFIYAAKTIGSTNRTILFRHLLPNAMGPILVTATMLIPSAIFMEAFMSFIGLGIAPPMASLGTMCNDSIQTLKSSPYQLFLPSLVICIIMFAFNYVGDGLRDALDPKLKK